MRNLTEDEVDNLFHNVLLLARAVETTIGELAAYSAGTINGEKDNQCFVGIFQNMPHLYNRRVIGWFRNDTDYSFPTISCELYIECDDKESIDIQRTARQFNGVITPIMSYGDGLYKFSTYSERYEIYEDSENTFEKNQIVIALAGYGPPRDKKMGNAFLYLGEIPNMKGHCAIVDRNGKTHWGWHIEDFRHPTEDEI